MKKVLITLLLFVIVLLGCGSPFIPDDVEYEQVSIPIHPAMAWPYCIYYTNSYFVEYPVYSVDWSAPRYNGVAETCPAAYTLIADSIVVPFTNGLYTNYSEVVIIWEIE